MTIDKFDDEVSLILRKLKNGGSEDFAHDEIMKRASQLLARYEVDLQASIIKQATKRLD